MKNHNVLFITSNFITIFIILFERLALNKLKIKEKWLMAIDLLRCLNDALTIKKCRKKPILI